MPSEFHFLVVDDVPIVRHIVVVLLRALGYTKVSEAENGAKALKLLASTNSSPTPINFIVTDWNMPVMDGMMLLQTIRATDGLKHLPVLMVTSEAQNDHILAAEQAGVDGYIVKPSLNARIFKETLDNILLKRGLAA